MNSKTDGHVTLSKSKYTLVDENNNFPDEDITPEENETDDNSSDKVSDIKEENLPHSPRSPKSFKYKLEERPSVDILDEIFKPYDDDPNAKNDTLKISSKSKVEFEYELKKESVGGIQKDAIMKLKQPSGNNQVSNSKVSKGLNKPPGDDDSKKDPSRVLNKISKSKIEQPRVVKPRSRSTSRPKYQHGVEIHERKSAIFDKTISPYACKVVPIPPSTNYKDNSKSKARVLISAREQRLLSDQLVKNSPMSPPDAETIDIITQSVMTNLSLNPNADHVNPPPQGWTTRPIPLKAWPNFCTLRSDVAKAIQTQTSEDDEYFKSLPFNSLPSTNPPADSALSPGELDLEGLRFLEKLAERLEMGIFSAAEACSVLIHTIFKESLGNPNSVEAILRSKEFQDFLHSPNEIQALEKVAVLLRKTSQTIDDYIENVEQAGISFPSVTDFSRMSSQIISVSSFKSIRAIVESNELASNVWSFVPPDSPEKFQLSVFYNPDTGEIDQTITCQDRIFRTRFSTYPLQNHKLRRLLSANREKIGLPATMKPDRLMLTILKCSAFTMTRLIVSKTLLEKCSKSLYEIENNFNTNKKYSLGSKKGRRTLNALTERLRVLNVFIGIVYQMSSELLVAIKCLQSAVWKTMILQDILKHPRIPGYPNPKLNKEIQLPWGAQIPIDEVMRKLSEGLKAIDNAYRMGQFSLQSLKYGVGIKRKYKRLLKDYLEGMKYLGNTRDIDFGSLLMNLLCNTELLNHFKDEIGYSDMYDRAAISMHVGKLNWGTVEALGAVKRMEADSQVLMVQTMSRLKQIRERQRENSAKKSGKFWGGQKK